MRALLIFLLALLAIPATTSAEVNYLYNVDTAALAANSGDFPETNINVLVGTIVSAVLGFAGVIFLILMIYAGMLWMTGGGNQDTIKKAKGILVNSVIGLVIVLSSYAIAATVIRYVGNSAN